jgi:hypothetical protein
MFYGKEKCRILKEIRRDIAKQNDIELLIEECRHKGDCLGTCPKCEAELRYLERELENRRKKGKKVILAGISTVVALNLASCDLLPSDRLMGEPMHSFTESSNGGDESVENGVLVGKETVSIEEIIMGELPLAPSLDVVATYLDDQKSLSSLLLGVHIEAIYSVWGEANENGGYLIPSENGHFIELTYDKNGYIESFEITESSKEEQ